MVRKMAYVGFSYLLGLFFASFFYFKLNVILGGVIFALSCLIMLSDKKHIAVYVCGICFSIGLIYYSFYEYRVYDNIVKYNNCTVTLDGIITDISDYSGDFSVYTVKGTINNEIKANVQYLGTSQVCKIGDEIHTVAKAEIPERNYTFDSENYYKCKGIYLSLSSPKDIVISEANHLAIKRHLLDYREYVYKKMDQYLTSDQLSIAKAMLFGDKSRIDDSTKTLLYRAGIGHIMAVSGVHISVVCSLIWMILSAAPINKYVKFTLLMIFAFCFVILAGASNSALRAAFMLILVYGAELFNRRADVMNSLGIAAILLTAGCPFVVRDASLLLSFTGVIGIAVVGPAVVEMISERFKLKDYMKSFILSVCVSAVIFPVSFLFFDEISVFAPVSNLILMPFCTIILICGVIVACTGGIAFIAFPVMKLCGLCCDIVLAIATTIGKMRIAYIPLGYDFIEPLIIIGIIVIVLSFIFIKKYKLNIFTCVTTFSVCIAVIWGYRFVPDNYTSVAVLHNNDGASAIVIHDNKSASVIDLNKGGKTLDEIKRYLNRLGIFKVDLLAMTVDDITSHTIYLNNFDLFDVGTVLLPEDNHSDEDIMLNFADRIEHYNIERDCIIEMPDYKMLLAGNNTIYIEANNKTVLAYNGKTDLGITGEYDAVIEYCGQKPARFIKGDTYICIDDDNRVSSSKKYYGDMVLIKLYKDRVETEVISIGGQH